MIAQIEKLGQLLLLQNFRGVFLRRHISSLQSNDKQCEFTVIHVSEGCHPFRFLGSIIKGGQQAGLTTADQNQCFHLIQMPSLEGKMRHPRPPGCSMGVWTDLEHKLAEERAGDYYYPPNPPKVILSSLMLLLLLGKDVSCRFCLLSDQTVI